MTDTPGLTFVTERIIGESWAEKYSPGIAAITASMRVETPCPICQHPSYDCTREARDNG